MDAHSPVKAKEWDRYPLGPPEYMTLKQIIELLQWSKELLELNLQCSDQNTIHGMYAPRMVGQYDEAIEELKRFMENTNE